MKVCSCIVFFFLNLLFTLFPVAFYNLYKVVLLLNIFNFCFSLFFKVNASCCEILGERFENALRSVFSSWGSFCVRQPSVVILGSLMLVVAFSGGLVYMRITTDPVDLWSSPTSQAREEKKYFDSHFGPFFRTVQLIITTPLNDSSIYSPYFGGSDVPFTAILNKDTLHQVSYWTGPFEGPSINIDSDNMRVYYTTHVKSSCIYETVICCFSFFFFLHFAFFFSPNLNQTGAGSAA